MSDMRHNPLECGNCACRLANGDELAMDNSIPPCRRHDGYTALEAAADARVDQEADALLARLDTGRGPDEGAERARQNALRYQEYFPRPSVDQIHADVEVLKREVAILKAQLELHAIKDKT